MQAGASVIGKVENGLKGRKIIRLYALPMRRRLRTRRKQKYFCFNLLLKLYSENGSKRNTLKTKNIVNSGTSSYKQIIIKLVIVIQRKD